LKRKNKQGCNAGFFKNFIIENNLLLFAVNIWIKKFQVVNIKNIFLEIISHYTSLKKTSIIIEDISNILTS
jgi:hypothetical protein